MKSESENLSENETNKEETEETECKPTSNQNLSNLHDLTRPLSLERKLPRINCEERIIFVVDVCKEEKSTCFQFSEGSSFSPLFMIKRALSLYLHNKRAINPNHKYALVGLQDVPIWLVDFTCNPRDIINAVELLSESESPATCDLSLIFDLISNQVTFPPDSHDLSVAPPPYIIRTIMFYGRSQCLPQFLTGKEAFLSLIKNPHFFLDVLYFHETSADENKCEGIFDLLCGLDLSGWSYIFEVGRNATKFHNMCSMLLSHPLQRPSQKDSHYTLLAKE